MPELCLSKYHLFFKVQFFVTKYPFSHLKITVLVLLENTVLVIFQINDFFIS